VLVVSALGVIPAFAGGPEGLRLYVFSSGPLGGFPKAALQIGGQGNVDAAPMFYVVKHPKGNVLFDAGNTDKPTPDAGWWGPLVGFGLTMTANHAIAVQLGTIGLKPADIKYVVLGHVHVGRSRKMGTFRNATFVIQNDALNAAAGVDFGASMYSIPGDFAASQRSNVVRLDGNLDLFNDRSVEIIRAPGHTPGRQFALVRLPKQGTMVLTSDRNVIPAATWSAMAMYEGYQIRQFRDAEGASIFYAHDPATVKATKQAPDYYE
jgi:N-acyl homoserine lactone hydrolase